MTDINIHRVVEVAISTRKHGSFNVHSLIAKDDVGWKSEVWIYTNDGKLLLTSLNGKSINEVA